MKGVPAIWLLMAGALWASQGWSADTRSTDGYALVAAILSDSRQERQAAATTLIERGDLSLVPGLVDAVFFTPKESRRQVLDALEALTGERRRGYYDWVEFVGAHAEITPAAGYPAWKLSLLSRIDTRYRTVFYDGAPARIRLEEIVWGGVPLAGIPALDDPPTIPASQAAYLLEKEEIFGIVVAGRARAYPLRFLSWHELLNDTLGGEPIVLSFCTLCGTGIFYRARTPDGGVYRFDTSGLLYLSNKLMVDRGSRTLWSNLTGEPVVGRLARSPVRLEMLAGTLTTWEAWRRQHPDTTVLDLRAIEKEMGPVHRYEYRPGAAERSRRGVSFPVWIASDALGRDREVFTLRLGGGAKAYPVDKVLSRQVVNDEIGGEPVVLIGDTGSGSVRAFRRASHVFRAGNDDRLLDESDRLWKVGETGLTALEPGALESPLRRLPGHVAFWFGWYAFFPHTEVWSG